MTLRFRWYLTWPDDARAIDDGYVRGSQLGSSADVLRVRLMEGGPMGGQWAWNCSRLKPADADGLRRYSTSDGYCDTKEEAQEAAEAFYFSAGGETENGS